MKTAVEISAQYTVNWIGLKTFLGQLDREDVLVINNVPFVIRPASPDDMERIGTGRVIDE